MNKQVFSGVWENIYNRLSVVFLGHLSIGPSISLCLFGVDVTAPAQMLDLSISSKSLPISGMPNLANFKGSRVIDMRAGRVSGLVFFHYCRFPTHLVAVLNFAFFTLFFHVLVCDIGRQLYRGEKFGLT